MSPDSPSSWKVAGVSVMGFAHQLAAEPRCDDAHAIWTDGEWLVAVVSDGAGSATHGAAGANLLCETLVRFAVERVLASVGEAGLVSDDVRSLVASGIVAAREQIEPADLRDYHATVAGVVAGPDGGTFYHIGDGTCIASAAGLSGVVVSPPENGQYANETYFFTMPDWQEHLRFVDFGAEQNCVMLLSDGVTPFSVLERDATPSPGFFNPLTEFLATHDRAVGEAALRATFEREEIRAITGDDKTLVWAMRTTRDA